MSGFPLKQPYQNQEIPPEAFFLYSRVEETISYQKAFELWQQQQHQQHQQHQEEETRQHHEGASSSSQIPAMIRHAGDGVSCQDCGNQAKKDCAHRRCRTCCKSRGFDCPTHVKSTWVPASRRRERQHQLGVLQHQRGGGGGGEGGENPKRLRDNLASCTRLPITTSGPEGGCFPAEVTSPAVFRCVRVRAVDDPEEEYAYQTSVSIAGRVFKGLLYDQGPERGALPAPGESSSGGGGAGPSRALVGPTLSSPTSTSAANSAAMVDSSSLYPAPLNAFMAGTQFFPPSR